MPSICNEAAVWHNRAEQARETADLLTDPGAREAVLRVAETFERLARAAVIQPPSREENWSGGARIYALTSNLPDSIGDPSNWVSLSSALGPADVGSRLADNAYGSRTPTA